MRQFALYLLASAVFLGGAASDPVGPKKAAATRPPAMAAKSPAQASPSATRRPTALASPGQPTLWAADTAGQCRQICAQTYYFCQADGTSQDCSPTFGQCAAACAEPGLPGLQTR